MRSKHTSRPQSYVIRRLADPAACKRNFLPDEVVDMSFDGFGLYWEADAVARCLKGGRRLSISWSGH